MSDLRHYQGIDFEIWDGQQTWFWFVIDPRCDGGAIGVASSETLAVRDACLAIDQMIYAVGERMTAAGWEISLTCLERYLSHCCGHSA
jgi:hypothetical protein